MVVPLIAVGIASVLGISAVGKSVEGVAETTGSLIGKITTLAVILLIGFAIINIKKF